jgi:hypothetical protein
MFEKHPHLGNQFGQGDDETTFNGATGCTHVMLQSLIFAKTSHMYSQDEISAIARYPDAAQNHERRGLRWGGLDNEVGRVVDHFNLPYELWFPRGPLTDAQKKKLLQAAELGPIMISVHYGNYPEWLHYNYNGVPTDGRPNGYARLHGKTQTYGFYGPHAALFLGWYWNKGRTFRIANMKEPNHGSASRPELPSIDKIKVSQLWVAANAIRTIDGRSISVLLPKRTFVPKG